MRFALLLNGIPNSASGVYLEIKMRCGIRYLSSSQWTDTTSSIHRVPDVVLAPSYTLTQATHTSVPQGSVCDYCWPTAGKMEAQRG